MLAADLSAAEYLVYIDQLPQAEIIEFSDMASRLSRMLYRLVQRFS